MQNIFIKHILCDFYVQKVHSLIQRQIWLCSKEHTEHAAKIDNVYFCLTLLLSYIGRA